MEPKTFQVGVKAVITAGGKLLVLREPGGAWDLPGGRMEPGESFEDTLRREMAEELPDTALLNMHRIVGAVSMPDLDGLGLVLLLHRVEVHLPPAGIVLSPEHEEYRWVSVREASELGSRVIDAAAYAHGLEEEWAEPAIKDIEAPCDHDPDDWVGYIQAGDPDRSPFCAVSTCTACVVASQGYVQMMTNRVASELVPFGQLPKQEATA